MSSPNSPHQRPPVDHDFNNNWGSIFAYSIPKETPLSTWYWNEMLRDAVNAQLLFSRLLSLYMDKFESFFRSLLPISIHGHVTDALNPQLVVSLILRLAIFSGSDSPDSIPISTPEDRRTAANLCGWEDIHLDSPCWAVPANGYAAAYGPVANLSGQPAFQDIACGPKAIELQIVGASVDDISRQLDMAKSRGCIGVIVEIVANQYGGRVIEPRELENISRLCAEKGLIFAIDETVTAVRCGAPFAYQRSEYKSALPPDLVFFGKALVLSGVAVNFDGSFLKRLAISSAHHKRQAVNNWASIFTQLAPLPLLILALGVLEQAVASNWVERATVVGRLLRDEVIKRARKELGDSVEVKDVLGGLESFIFVRIDIHGCFLMMGASSAGPWVPWVRWLPRLDEEMLNPKLVQTILGAESRPIRENISVNLTRQGLKPPWCFWCGNKANNQKVEWCRRCCIHVCDTDACTGKLASHQCF
ncbi:hypothetical protein BDW59DRAFT_106505 [Aspergillus cavernicola]|uniref:Pyridoxal phosphate-dependent transferase n=1 Tax=Aspergillus cavernicola TaxID=176166 RepID=A0ABR4IXX9_9EURO